MTETLMIQVSREDLQVMISSSVKSAINDIVPASKMPQKRSEIMKSLGIKTVRTFNKRVEESKIKSCGKIELQPAYYLQDFFN